MTHHTGSTVPIGGSDGCPGGLQKVSFETIIDRNFVEICYLTALHWLAARAISIRTASTAQLWTAKAMLHRHFTTPERAESCLMWDMVREALTIQSWSVARRRASFRISSHQICTLEVSRPDRRPRHCANQMNTLMVVACVLRCKWNCLRPPNVPDKVFGYGNASGRWSVEQLMCCHGLSF